MSRVLFIYRRDLRDHDNIGLNNAAKDYDEVFPVFFIDPRQQVEKNDYFPQRAFNFMINRLKALKVSIFYGLPHEIVGELCKKEKFDACYTNMDYTPFSIQRDAEIKTVLDKHGVKFLQFHDYCLNSPLDVKPYKVFTPYYNFCSKLEIQPVYTKKPKKVGLLKHIKGYTDPAEIKTEYKKYVPDNEEDVLKAIKAQKDYVAQHDQMAHNSSRISAAIKFGIISIREAFQASKIPEFQRQLYWRDFYTQLAYHFPHVLKGPNRNLRPYNFVWEGTKKDFEKWCEGKTGVDIVDAGMRELVQTGFLHNRARLIVANYLIHKLKIDWQLGEKFFAKNLIDYDPCVNNGNWQYMTPAGTNNKGYVAYNPDLQKEKYDKEGLYRKKWKE